MKKHLPAASLPLTMAQLSLASWEVIMRRTAMMATNTCSVAEYQRMVTEKTAAAMATGVQLAFGSTSMAALLAPWHRRATANVRRLRRK